MVELSVIIRWPLLSMYYIRKYIRELLYYIRKFGKNIQRIQQEDRYIQVHARNH